MNLRKAGLAAAAVATVGAGVLGGAAIATAADDTGAARHGSGFGPGPGGGPAWQHGGPFGDEEVSDDQLASVTEAVEAYDDTLTVEHVVADDDGSFLVLVTTADDAREALTVSADLATVEEAERPFGGPGGPGRFGGEAVEGDELADVTAAVTAYDDSLTVEHVVQRDDEGDYLVLATGGEDERTALRVSADLATVEEVDGPFGGPGGPFGGTEVEGDELADVTAAVTAHDGSLTVERVFQRDDEGDYLVLATGGEDERTALRVSADLQTVEELDGPPFGGPGGFRGPGGPGGTVTS